METNKRGWIKNLIIIFLVLVLVFTLFSNTFMNRSLPEVAVSNAESGSITTQVKLTGTVNANSVKAVTLEAARKINEVLVRRGDTVSPGTVLATLVVGESTEIADLEIELKQLQIEYKKMQLETEDSLIALRYKLQDAEKELAELQKYESDYPNFAAQKQAYEDKITALESQMDAYKNAIDARAEEMEAKQNEMDAVKEALDDLQKQINKLPDVGSMTLEELSDAIKDAESALKEAEKSTRRARTTLTAAENAENSASLMSASALKTLNEANTALENAQKAVEELNTARTALVSERETLDARIAEIKKIPEADRTEAEKNELADKETRIAAVRREISQTDAAISAAKDTLTDAAAKQKTAAENNKAYSEQLDAAISNKSSASANYKSCIGEEDSAKKTLNNLNKGWTRTVLQEEYDKQQDTYDEMAKDYKLMEKDSAKMEKLRSKVAEQKTEVETERDEYIKENMPQELKEVEAKLTSLDRDIEDYKRQLRIAEANASIDGETEALNLSIQRTKIEQKQKQIEKLREKVVSTELKATVNGTISTLNMANGDDIAAGTTVAEIATSDGYTMECSVPNAQASRLRIGQVGEVQYYYWGDKPKVTVTTIKNDPNNSGKSKVITLAVEGDIADGTSLTVTVGSQGSSYDCIVPNSAIQEDSEGKFILVVTSKSSPLGNRYYAQRKNVTVLASEATRSAIDASLSWGEYVITGATNADGRKVPISDGMQVRMAEK